MLRRILKSRKIKVPNLIRRFSNIEELEDFVPKGEEENAIKEFFEERKRFHETLIEKNPLDPNLLTSLYIGVGISTSVFITQASTFGIFTPLAYSIPILFHAGMNIAAGVSITDLMKEEHCNKDFEANMLMFSGVFSSVLTTGLMTLDFGASQIIYGSLIPILINIGGSVYVSLKKIAFKKLGIGFVLCALASFFSLAALYYFIGLDGIEDLRIRESEDYERGIIFQSIDED